MSRSEKAARFAIFAVNFSASTFLFLASILSIVTGAISDPDSLLGGIVMVMPAGLYALAEWFAYYHDRRSLERPLGILNLCCGGIVAFATIMSVWDSLTADDPPSLDFFIGFGFTFGMIAAYLAGSGLFRMRSGVRQPLTDSDIEPPATA